jgi:ABC-type uncharacterized transport system auxiliary subunit
MKKIIAMFAIAAVFAACGSGEEKAATTDSAATPAVDTTAPAAVDTTKVDTTAAVADTTKK